MDRRILLVEIGPGLQLTGAMPPVEIDTAYSARVRAFGGNAPYQYEVIDGALPSSMFLEPFSGEISGQSPSYAEDYTFTIEVTDARGLKARRTFLLRVYRIASLG